jgi:DNA polymerase-3 subunit epsilon|tara:strand:+ start:369 stop:1118 length:750 start_codon:yes stop_codon:yes gene_type:complete
MEAAKERLVAFDCETTGLDVENDRIVEIAILEYPDNVLLNVRIKPDVSMTAQATKITGITDDDLAEFQPFAAWAETAQKAIDGAILLGYGSRRFDTLILNAELRRAGQPGIDLDNVEEIDLYRVWTECEPHTLTGALARFLNLEHKNAHGALPDVNHLFDLATAMSEKFEIDRYKMIELSKPADEVDRSGRLKRNEAGEVVWWFGRTKNEKVTDHVGLIHWCLNRDFPADTKQELRLILEQMQAEQMEA